MVSEKCPLYGKKILFFCPAFFGYEKKIQDKMISLGAEVVFFDERPIHHSYQKALVKINPNIFSRRTEKYYVSILKNISSIEFDYVLFIKCEMPTSRILRLYRKTFEKATFCLYLWDSLDNIKNIESKLTYFDTIKSFDLKDSQQYGMLQFRPLFFSDEYRKQELGTEIDFDICFLGTIHSDRYSIIKEVEQFCKKNQLKMFSFKFLQSKFIYYFYKLTKKEFLDTKLSNFDFHKMSSQSISEVVNHSNIVLDIQHPNQTGLTMRTIEMIGMNKKIITTNSSIKQYDFYNPQNIFVIDRNNIELDLSIFNKNYIPLDSEVYERYSLTQWVLEVLEVGKYG